MGRSACLAELGLAFLTIGFGGDPRVREAQFGPAGRQFAQELSLLPHNHTLRVKDLGAFEAANNPAGDLLQSGAPEIDSNGPDGNLYVTNRSIDAGVGEVLRIRP